MLESLMIHTIDLYQSHDDQDGSGGPVRQFALVTPGIRCNFQSDMSIVFDQRTQRRERKGAAVYLTSASAFAKARIDDVMVFGGVPYRVVGKEDMCNLTRCFAISLEEEVSDIELVCAPIGGVATLGTATATEV